MSFLHAQVSYQIKNHIITDLLKGIASDHEAIPGKYNQTTVFPTCPLFIYFHLGARNNLDMLCNVKILLQNHSIFSPNHHHFPDFHYLVPAQVLSLEGPKPTAISNNTCFRMNSG